MKDRDRTLNLSPDPELDKGMWEHILRGAVPTRQVPTLEEHGYIRKLAEGEYDITVHALCHLHTTYPSLYRRTQKALREAVALKGEQ